MRLALIVLSVLVLASCSLTGGSQEVSEPLPPLDGPVDINGNALTPGALVPLGAACGGMMGLACQGADTGDTFCAYEPAQQCGAADQMGRCRVRPVVCPSISRPVCGCDGRTYSSACEARAAGVGISSPRACPLTYAPEGR